MPVERLTPERRRELTRTALIEAAAELFARKGLHATSLDEIAEAAGFTRGAIYSNFGGKDDLLLAVVERHSAQVLATYSETAERRDVEDSAVDAMARIRRQNRDLMLLSLELRLHALRNPDLRKRLVEMHRRHAERVAEAIERATAALGSRLAYPPREVADLVWAASEGVLLFAAIDEERAEYWDGLARRFIEMVRASLEK